MAQLVDDDQRPDREQEGDDDEPERGLGKHQAAISLISPSANALASRSMSITSAMDWGAGTLIRLTASSTVRTMSRKPMRRARKAATATSLAALRTIGADPLASRALLAARRAGKRSRSGCSKDRVAIFARSSLSAGVSIRSGQASV